MYTTNTFQAEIDFRRNRIQSGAAGGRRTRMPFVRRPAESRRAAR